MHKIQRNSSNGQFHCVVCWCTFSWAWHVWVFWTVFLEIHKFTYHIVFGVFICKLCANTCLMCTLWILHNSTIQVQAKIGNAFKVTVTKSGPQHTSATVLYASASIYVQWESRCARYNTAKVASTLVQGILGVGHVTGGSARYQTWSPLYIQYTYNTVTQLL